jgi:hypothetical protein
VGSRRYRAALRTTVATSALPYGYTLTVWTTGAILSHARGIPDTGEALLLLVGAVAAYALVGGIAFGGLSEQLAPPQARAAVWGALHLISVGAAIVAATAVAHTVQGTVAWPLDGFVVTAVYLLVSALQLVAAHTRLGTGGA